MKIIGIVGSLRRGNTYTMVESACQSIKDFDVEFIHLKDISMNHCDGCLVCDETSNCTISDDMSQLIEKIKEADGFILGTPARWGLLSGELKTFFDRLNPLAVPELLAGKKAIIFTVGQSKPEEAESIKLAAESVKTFCENADIEVVDVVMAYDCLNEEDIITKNKETLDYCKDSALKLCNSIVK